MGESWVCCWKPLENHKYWWPCPTNTVLEYRKVTRLGIELRPSGYIPDALTTELSSLVGFNHKMNFMYLPPQMMVTSHPQRTIQSTIDHQGQPYDDSATTTWARLNSSDRLHNPSSTHYPNLPLSVNPNSEQRAGAHNLLEYRKVTRLGIEPRPPGHIPDALLV